MTLNDPKQQKPRDLAVKTYDSPIAKMIIMMGYKGALIGWNDEHLDWRRVPASSRSKKKIKRGKEENTCRFHFLPLLGRPAGPTNLERIKSTKFWQKSFPRRRDEGFTKDHHRAAEVKSVTIDFLFISIHFFFRKKRRKVLSGLNGCAF